jgi:hypothetical protein
MSRLLSTLKALAFAAALTAPSALPAIAGQAENAVLASYAGEWRGTGKVTGPDPGTVVCRITFKPTSSGKLTYSGRCSFGGTGSASFRGTMLYNDAQKRYEASTSAQGMGSATTIGKKQGGGIVFASSGMKTRYGTASSVMTLAGNAIKMSFKLVDKDGTSASSISFKKR